jgi:hypothetical protein
LKWPAVGAESDEANGPAPDVREPACRHRFSPLGLDHCSSVTRQLEEHDGDRRDGHQRYEYRTAAPTGSAWSVPLCVMLVAMAAPAEDGNVSTAFVAETVVAAVVDCQASP